MSVLDRSCFSYQVAPGSTTSDSSVEEVCRKSSDSSRSSLPSGASSCHTTSRGRSSGDASSARSEEWVPSRCRVKYSAPLAEEPSRLARHRFTIRGQFRGASGSSQANRRVPARSSPTARATGSPGASPRSSGLRSNVG